MFRTNSLRTIDCHPRKLCLLIILLAISAATSSTANNLAQAAAPAAAPSDVLMENRTYSTLWFRVHWKGNAGEWWALLPGEKYRVTSPQLVVELRLAEGYRKFTLQAGQTYCLGRNGPLATPLFTSDPRDRAAGKWRRPQPPAAQEFRETVSRVSYGSASSAFAPLERFVDRSEEYGDEYRLSLLDFFQEAAAAQANGKLPEGIRFVKGFTWFFGYIVDREHGDVILLGVKDPARPPIDIDCLVTALKAVAEDKIPRCSLDEHPDPRFQKSVVGGVPWQSRWAEIMIDADYDMKKVCQGHLDPKVPGLMSWYDRELTDAYWNTRYRGSGSSNTQDRWWFNFDSNIDRGLVSDERDLVVLHRNPVRLSTERKVNGQYGTGTIDYFGERFAQDFSNNMSLLGKHYPNVAQLEALYRLYDLAFHLNNVSRFQAPGARFWKSIYRGPYAGPPGGMPTLTRNSRIDDVTGGYVLTRSVKGGVSMKLEAMQPTTTSAAPATQLVRRLLDGQK